MKRFYVYIDASVIGGCEDSEFAEATLALWQLFIQGVYIFDRNSYSEGGVIR